MTITLCLSRIFQLDAFNDQFQLCPVEHLFLAGLFIVIELALLESLGPNTEPTTIKIEDLELGLAPIDEHKEIPTERIFTDQVFRHGRQAGEGAAHIRGFGIEPYLDLGFREKHQTVRTRSMTPGLSSNSTCQCLPTPESSSGDGAWASDSVISTKSEVTG